ncbi:MAG: DNA topoisomerase I, partial [Bacteroidetes bacterium SW_4_67_19]
NAGDRPLGIHPEHDMPVLLKNGPYGPYVQLGDNEQQGKPKRVSLPPGIEPKDVDFDLALQIINLPRVLGEHPDDGQPVDTHIGRYGPYVRHDGTNASLVDDQTIENVTMEEAVQLISEKEA